jgi:hypothetical protein
MSYQTSKQAEKSFGHSEPSKPKEHKTAQYQKDQNPKLEFPNQNVITSHPEI